jgi:transposase
MGFALVDRSCPVSSPKSVNDLVPDNHFAKFIVAIVALFDLTKITSQYTGRGKEAYPPDMLLSLLMYSYATGVTSCREMYQKTFDIPAYMFICNMTHPHYNTISYFRARFSDEIEELFTQLVVIAASFGLLEESDSGYIDGTKMKANASKHHAMSYGHAIGKKAVLEEEIAQLEQMSLDGYDDSLDIDIPEEIKLRKKKLAIVNKVIEEIKQRADERYEMEMKDYQQKMADRKERELKSGKKSRGKEPKPPVKGPTIKDQYNLTDPDSRIMLSNQKSFIQAYNCQAVVESVFNLIIEAHITNRANDKQEIKPAVKELKRQKKSLPKIVNLAGDTGYCSKSNFDYCIKNGLDPYIAVGREHHHKSTKEQFSKEPPELPENASAMDKMRHKLQTSAGKAIYKLRKQVVEPVFGVIKSAIGIRQFRLRGLKKVSAEWKLICMSYNLKKCIVFYNFSYEITSQAPRAHYTLRFHSSSGCFVVIQSIAKYLKPRSLDYCPNI